METHKLGDDEAGDQSSKADRASKASVQSNGHVENSPTPQSLSTHAPPTNINKGLLTESNTPDNHNVSAGAGPSDIDHATLAPPPKQSTTESAKDPGDSQNPPKHQILEQTAERLASSKGNLIEDEDKDKQSQLDLRRKVWWALMGYDDEQSLEDRIKEAPQRNLQQVLYSKLVEDRICELERRLAEIENKGIDPEQGDAIGPRNLILEVNRIGWQEYKPKDSNAGAYKQTSDDYKHKSREEFPSQFPDYVIDVVIDTTQSTQSVVDNQNKGQHHAQTEITETKGVADKAGPGSKIFPQTQPERIRVNSALLLRALEKITGLTFTTSKVSDKNVLKDQVFLKPFKLFVTYEQQIRDFATRLEQLNVQKETESEPRSHTKSLVSQVDGTASSTESPNQIHKIAETLQSENRIVQSGTAAKSSVTGDPLESARCLQELRVLLQVLDEDLRPTFNLRRELIEGTVHEIAFQDLWHLFRLGGEIQSDGSSGVVEIFRTLNVCGGRPFLCSRAAVFMDDTRTDTNERDIPTFDILCFNYITDGKELGACHDTFSIKRFDGLKAIRSLPCYPRAFSKVASVSSSGKEFIDRGKRAIELIQQENIVHKRYDGLTVTAGKDPREEVDSKVIVDIGMAALKKQLAFKFDTTSELRPDPRETTELLDPRCRREGCCQNTPIHKDYVLDSKLYVKLFEDKSFMRDSLELDADLRDDDYLLCPGVLWGYVLRSRKWALLDVNLIEDIEESRDGFNSLVLPEGHKDTLLALVETHSKGRKLDNPNGKEAKQLDLVPGKGKGLIILLHGEPGVGKSSTAECVAEYTRRPLFQVTCGDIGETADEVEARLENHFQLAHKWGCVLLLDEADVFLEARSRTDLKRNAIVSVFLRVLEYYSGILFLTTNRVGSFDQAFRSRIHMSLFYPKIRLDFTIQIWEMNLVRAKTLWGENLSITEENGKEILKFAKDHFNELAKYDSTWNGRQIRNAFQTAIALAEWEAHKTQVRFKSPAPLIPTLEKEHFKRVAEASKHFDNYLRATVGSEGDVARERIERRDDLDMDIDPEDKRHIPRVY